jgi:hypothetical protein
MLTGQDETSLGSADDAGAVSDGSRASVRCALVPVPSSPVPQGVAQAADPDRSPALSAYPAAPFLTHLIATAAGAPQTRARRRADPGRAIAAYTASMRGAA